MTLIPRGDLDENNDTTDYSVYRWRNGISKTLVASGTDVQSASKSYFHGYDTPNFHARKKKGELIPMTPFTQFQFSGSATGSYDVTYRDAGGVLWRFATEGNRPLTSEVGCPAQWMLTEDNIMEKVSLEDADVYLQAAASKVYSNGYDLLTAVAELADTKRLFISVLQALLRGLKDLPSWVSLYKVSGRWLSLRYGWRTLMYDIESLDKAIRTFDDQRKRFSERSGNTQEYTETSTVTTTWSYLSIDYDIIDTISVGLRGSVVADIDVPKIQINPLITGWELVPFSFVIDWFVSVGKSLAALSFLVAQSEYTASRGISVTLNRQITGYIATTEPTFVGGFVEQSATSTVQMVRRQPTRVPLLPRFQLKLNVWKIADLLALLLQRIR